MTELAIREPDAVVAVPAYSNAAVSERDIIDGWIKVVADVGRLADYIAETDFVPKALRNKPAAIAACILTGRELSIGPMQSLKAIHMVQGVPTLSAEYKRARALAAGHEIVIDETTSTRCVIRGRRKGSDRWVTIKWDMDMARKAKLAGKDIWQAYPQRMLQARASGELCDILFPDASLGLATKEVLEDGGIVTESGVTVDAATGEVTSGTTPAIEAPKARTAQRAQRAPRTAPPAPAASTQAATPAASGPRQDAGGALPPLPGEEEGPTTSGASSSAGAPGTASLQETGESSPSSPASSASEAVTNRQLTAIWTILTKEFAFGAEEKEQARGVCAVITGRDITSTTQLTKAEGIAIIDTLSQWKHQAAKEEEEPRGYLIQMLTALDSAREQGGEVHGE